MKKKFNWWVIISIIVIGLPLGYVGMGVFKNVSRKDPIAMNRNNRLNEERKEKVSNDNSNLDIKDEQLSQVTQDEEVVGINSTGEGGGNDRDRTNEAQNNLRQREENHPENISSEEQARKLETQRLQREEQRLQREEQEKQREEQAKQREEQAKQRREDQARQREEQAKQRREEQARLREEQRLKREEETRQRQAEQARLQEEQRLRQEEQARIREEQARLREEQAKKQAEQARQQAEQERIQKENALKAEVQSIVASGQKSNKVPDGCTIVVNGRNSTDYQAFRMGVNYKAYTNVRVSAVTADSNGKVTRIAVTATESKDTE